MKDDELTEAETIVVKVLTEALVKTRSVPMAAGMSPWDRALAAMLSIALQNVPETLKGNLLVSFLSTILGMGVSPAELARLVQIAEANVAEGRKLHAALSAGPLGRVIV